MKNTDVGLLISRITLGLLMLLHGIAKLQNGVGGIARMLEKTGLPEVMAYGVYIGEVVAPIMLIAGFRIRFAAVIYIATMLVAVLVAHPDGLFALTKSGGWAVELQALYLFGALALFFTGGGKYAVSAKNSWN